MTLADEATIWALFAELAAEAEWKERAACRDYDPDLFYPEPDDDGWAAKGICERCPVREQCLDAAIRRHDPYGVWGGTTYKERKKMPGWVRPHGTNARYFSCAAGPEGGHCDACKAAHARYVAEHRPHRARVS